MALRPRDFKSLASTVSPSGAVRAVFVPQNGRVAHRQSCGAPASARAPMAMAGRSDLAAEAADPCNPCPSAPRHTYPRTSQDRADPCPSVPWVISRGVQQRVADQHALLTGVATSITAFGGRTLRGPVDVPVLAESWDHSNATSAACGRSPGSPSRYATSSSTVAARRWWFACSTPARRWGPPAATTGQRQRRPGGGHFAQRPATACRIARRLGQRTARAHRGPDADTVDERARAFRRAGQRPFTCTCATPHQNTKKPSPTSRGGQRAARRHDARRAATLIRTGPLAAPIPHAQPRLRRHLGDDRLSSPRLRSPTRCAEGAVETFAPGGAVAAYRAQRRATRRVERRPPARIPRRARPRDTRPCPHRPRR